MALIKPALYATISIILIGAALAPICLDYGEDDDLYVVVLAGQSNAAYRFADVSLVNTDVSAPSQDCYYYGTSISPVLYETYSSEADYKIYSMYGNGWKIGNIEPTLAKYLGDITGHNVLVINCGVSGASISQLVPGATYNDWTTTIINDALGEIEGHYKKLGFVWVQGEADTNMAESTYIDYFDDMLSYYEGLGFKESFIIQTKGINSRYAQQEIVRTHDNVHMATDVTKDFSIYNGMINVDDTVHYTQAADNIIGKLTGEYMGDFFKTPDLPEKGIIRAIPIITIIAVVVGISAAILRSRD